ncbi:short-chain dehydrogenase, partial [Colletotrichum asianum]
MIVRKFLMNKLLAQLPQLVSLYLAGSPRVDFFLVRISNVTIGQIGPVVSRFADSRVEC